MGRWLAALSLLLCGLTADGEPIVVGSKNFTESYLLAEIMARSLEKTGFDIERRFGLGGTKICYAALQSGDIDVYPEYTGTIAEVILKDEDAIDEQSMRALLAAQGLETGATFGFNNTYAIVVREQLAGQLKLTNISNLENHTELRASFSHEFLNRPDGWPGLAHTYGLQLRPNGIEHGLAYNAIRDGEIDITDAYSTDGELTAFNLRILHDERDYFPQYLALPLMRMSIPSRAKDVLATLGGTLTDDAMRRLNARIVVDRAPIETVADAFFTGRSQNQPLDHVRRTLWDNLLRNTLRHLQLTLTALALATLVGLGVAMLIHQSRAWSCVALNFSGVLQTIPSIALLALMIPLFGIGFLPAIIALFLYSLLPILRNAVTALTTVDPVYTEVAEAMGLTPSQKLRHVLIPLSVPHILAGIRTAAVISIGTATLAAFIGAGGLGEPIVTGLALNDTRLILQGAIPAAILALITEFLFASIERAVIPAHLREPH